ncbi:DUF3304 domain-containing protein [Neisseria macacae]|uniref:DUF3304 domain-containing protein n=1 Tax=Neisseria macacae ATCC 33926 TaxID=997348 RepID=A0AA36UH25_9NEIS|nr:DUF3304 domain-containing protein [Neisseria macacae]EGQ75124.1 hypothetical protein HMPREF9418_2515 [Neisseria macacae ATCC 33926]
MKKLFRFLGLVVLVAALPVLSIYASSVKEIFNQKDDFFVDTDKERSFAFMLSNYSDQGVMITYHKIGETWALNDIGPYSEGGGGQCCVSIPRWHEGMTLPLTLTISTDTNEFEERNVNAKVDKFTDEDNGLLQFHILPDYSVRVLIQVTVGRGRKIPCINFMKL